MEQPKQTKSRKTFLMAGAAILAALAFWKFIPSRKRSQIHSNDESVMMLTREGKLVKIDKRLLSSASEKISNEDLQNWIKDKKNQKGNLYGKQ